MNRSRAWFADVASETGYRADTLEKVTRLGELAAEVARHPLLGQVLVLKGGTALNLAFGPPSRLSVDLDFNYTGSETREGMLEQRPTVERSVAVIARAGGYQLQWSRSEHAGRKAYLRYLSTAGTADRIELDLNYLHRIPLDPPGPMELWQPGEAPVTDACGACRSATAAIKGRNGVAMMPTASYVGSRLLARPPVRAGQPTPWAQSSSSTSISVSFHAPCRSPAR